MFSIEKMVSNGKPVKNRESKEKILEIAYKTWEEVKPLIEEKYPEFNTNFCLKLNDRLRTTGGRAFIYRDNRTNKIELNTRLLAENLEEVRMVVIHEIAHLIQYTLFKGQSRGHDWMFKDIMESLGCKATVTHSMDTKKFSTKKKEWIYQCEKGCIHKLSTRRHNNIQRKGHTYTCRKTRKPLELLCKESLDIKTELEKQIANQLLG